MKLQLPHTPIFTILHSHVPGVPREPTLKGFRHSGVVIVHNNNHTLHGQKGMVDAGNSSLTATIILQTRFRGAHRRR